MNIGILVHDITTFGGVEYVSTQLAEELSLEHNVDLISLRSNEQSFFDMDNITLLNVNVLSKRGILRGNDYKIVSAFFAERHYEKIIIQLSTVFRNLCPLADSRLLKILSRNSTELELVFHESPKYFVTRYNVYYERGPILWLRYLYTYFHYNPSIYRFMQQSKKYVSHYVTLSKGCQSELRKYFNMDSEVRYNPYKFDLNSICLDSKENKIVWAGRVSAEKNLPLLLSAWNNVSDKKDWTLELIGDGIEKENVRKTIMMKSIQNVVQLDALPHDLLMREFEKSKILILPSFFEAFPTVIPEAMNKKNAVICTRYDGFSDELVKDGLTGFVVGFNATELTEKIECLMNNDKLLLSLQNKAYENCRNFYSVKEI